MYHSSWTELGSHPNEDVSERDWESGIKGRGPPYELDPLLDERYLHWIFTYIHTYYYYYYYYY